MSRNNNFSLVTLILSDPVDIRAVFMFHCNLSVGNCSVVSNESVHDGIWMTERDVILKGCKADIFPNLTNRIALFDDSTTLRVQFDAYDVVIDDFKPKSFVNVQTSDAFIALSSRTSLICIDRSCGSITANIPYSAAVPHLHDDVIIFVNPSSTNVIPYGGSESPAALDISIYRARDGSIRGTYEISFSRVSYFPNTLYVRTMGSGDASLLLISCWDDMNVKMVKLHSGALVATLHQTDDHNASVKCIASNDRFIAVGFEWQRYLKLSPLCIYNSSGERLHQLAANGASPKQLQINNDILFSIAEHAKEVRIWSLESGERLYSVPAVSKVVWFAFREEQLYIATNASGVVFNTGLTDQRKDINLTVWDYSRNEDELRHIVAAGGEVLIGGKKPAAKRKNGAM